MRTISKLICLLIGHNTKMHPENVVDFLNGYLSVTCHRCGQSKEWGQ